MTPTDPTAAQRMRDALSLIVSNTEGEVGRVRARIGSLVAAVLADAHGLVERHKADGADVVDASFVSMRVRELASAQAELADKRERLRAIEAVVDFAENAADRKPRS